MILLSYLNKVFDALFPEIDYQKELDRFLKDKPIKNTQDLEYWVRVYRYKSTPYY